MGQPLLFVIRVAHNQVSVCWSEHECEQLRLVFSHPRTLLGQYQVLLHGLKPVLQQVKTQHEHGRWWHKTPTLLWLLPPQLGGVTEMEVNTLRELGFEISNGRCFAYVFEAEAMSYAQAQAIIPTLTRI